MEEKDLDEYQKVPYPDHPDRCMGIKSCTSGQSGQCVYFKMEGSDYCRIHGGVAATGGLTAKSLNIYKIKKFEKRLFEFKTANGVRTIDEELALLRMMLEETVNKCESEMEFLLFGQKIIEIVREIRTTVIAADKLATKAATLIGRAEAIVIAGKVVEIISKFVLDDKVLTRISNEIAQVFITPEREEVY